jgi:hypothetical protein
MILKKAGVTHLSLLRTIVLFPVDCNYAFKYVGRGMMKNAEKGHALAPEQYGSRKYHHSIDLAVNKALTFDLLRQLKKPGGLCSNDANTGEENSPFYTFSPQFVAVLGVQSGANVGVSLCIFGVLSYLSQIGVLFPICGLFPHFDAKISLSKWGVQLLHTKPSQYGCCKMGYG